MNDVIINIVSCLLIVSIAYVLAQILNVVDTIKRDKIYLEDMHPDKTFPIVTIMQNNKSFKFMIDTGANVSTISDEYITEFQYECLDGISTIRDVHGDISQTYYVNVKFHFPNKKKHYKEEFMVGNLAGLDYLSDYGKVYGIVGNDFLIKHKNILNFKENTLYI